MKLILIIISLFLLTVPLFTQNKADSSNIYLQALSEHLEYLKEFNIERPDLIEILDVYYIEKDWIATNIFPTEIDGQKIEILTKEEITNKVKGDNSISLLAVRPVQRKNDRMEIYVIGFRVSGNKRQLEYVNQMNGSSFKIQCAVDSESPTLKMIEK